MDARPIDSPDLRTTSGSRARRVVFWFAVVANLALLGLAAQHELTILSRDVELPPRPHPILREHAREPADHGYLILLAVCFVNLVGLRSMRRRRDPGPLVHVWILAVLFLAPAALGYGLVIGAAITRGGLGTLEGMEFPAPEHLWFVLAVFGYFATLLALRSWMAWRPSWWQWSLFFLPMLVIELAFACPPVMELVETALHGPPPADDAPFGASIDDYLEVGDPSEWMFPLLFALWFVLFLCGALRRLVQIADERELTLSR